MLYVWIYSISSKETLQMLFISALPQCGVYSKAALIRGWRLIPLRVFTCNRVPSTFTHQFPADAMIDMKLLSAVLCVQVYSAAHHRRAVKARNRRG